MFYPVWVEPTTSEVRFFVYITVVAWTLVNIIIFHNFLIKSHIQPLPPISLSIKPDKYAFALFALLLIYTILHLYPISFPLVIIDDEAAHASFGLSLISRFFWMTGLDPNKYIVFMRVSLWIVCLLTAILLSIKTSRLFLKRMISLANSKVYILFLTILFVISIIIFILSKDMQYQLALMRYPPIGKILYAFFISLLGINEFSVRIPQLLFTILGSLIIFKICEENFNSSKMGLISASVFAFSPLVFYQSALAELVCGTVFFSIIIIYFYLKYLKTNHTGFLIISFYFISLGFLYKRILIVMLPAVFMSLLLLKEYRVKFSMLLKLSYFCLVPILPYIAIGKMYPNNPFGLNFSNWLRAGPALGYFILLLEHLSYPLYILSAISAIYILVKKDVLRPTVFVFFSSAVLYYVFFTSTTIHGQGPYIYGLHRYAMIFYPFIAISVGLFIDNISTRMKWKHSFNLLSCVLIVYLILICTIWQVPPLNRQFVTYKNIESHYFPVDKAMQWIKDNIREEKILILRVASAIFYRDKYGIKRDKIVDFWYDLHEVATPKQLKIFYRENKISYIMFSYRAAEDMDILKYLEGYRGNEFTEVAKFNLDGNYIFIYKINKVDAVS